MPQLDACPLCRTVLPLAAEPGESVTTCPGCGADLTPYADLEALAVAYRKLAQEMLSRGQTDGARRIVNQLPRLTELEDGELTTLTARLALADGDYQRALALAQNCDPGVASELHAAVNHRRQDQLTARELYNYALSSARQGAMSQAARQLSRAVTRDPTDPNIWLLKLKLDLKCGFFQRCYADLAALDRLAARPPEYATLEELLPPVS